MMRKFEDNFTDWLNKSLAEAIPPDVEAFCFNLYQPAGESKIKFGIELIGAKNFDEFNEDWPCEEIWEPTQRQLFIPISYSTNNWETCQSKMRKLIEGYLCSNNELASIFKQYKAVAIGFVDGNLELIWVKS